MRTSFLKCALFFSTHMQGMQIRSKKYISRLTFLTTIFSLMAIVHYVVMLISMLVHRPKKAIIHHHYLWNFFCRVHVEESADGRGRDLVFRSLQVDDEGEYSCEAIIDGINEKKIFYLKVIGKKNFDDCLISSKKLGSYKIIKKHCT